jgi:Tfp pilus assembly protein PilN
MAKAAPKSTDLNIDLLPKSTASATSGEAVHWALTVGRYLVIFTEIVALGAFLIAIWLSKEKNDLKVSVKQKQAEIAQYQNCDPSDTEKFCEDRFRKIQTQINQIVSLENSQDQNNKVMSELLTLLPVGIKLESLGIDKNQLDFSGSLPSETELQTLIKSINNSSKITTLDITSLTKENNVLKFTATAEIERAGFQTTQGEQN